MKIDNYRGDLNFKYIICPSRLSGSLYVSEIGKRCFQKERGSIPSYRDFYTIHFLCSGDGKFRGEPFVVGQGFVSFPDEKCWYERGEEWDVYWIKFGGTDAASFLQGAGLTGSRVIDLENSSALFGRLDEFLESPERTESATEMDFLVILFEILSSVRVPEGAPQRPSDYVKCAMQYIDENYDMDISVASIAANLHISEKHLWRVFKERVGTSPKSYIIECRLRRAEELLREFPDIRIGEIAASVGYGTPEAFLQAYKRHRGYAFRKA